MKVALVTPYSWTTPGGANSHVAGLAESLRERGHEVRILAPADAAVAPGIIALGGTFGVPFNGSVARIAFGPRIAARVRVALRRASPDVVHVHEPFAPGAAMLATISARVPVVATFHAAVQSRVYRAARAPLRRLWRKIDAKIAVSPAARDTIEALFGAGARIIPNGIDCARYTTVPSVNPRSRTILFTGRLERRKGPQILVEAIPKVLERHPDARFVIAGDGPLREGLEASIPPGARETVSFTGFFGEDARIALLASASIACLPAIGGESWGYTLVEAMAAGLPTVASAIPGYRGVARDGIDSMLVPPGDAVALAYALNKLLDDPGLVERLGSAARESARRFDWKIVSGAVEAVYSEVLAAL